jgi:peptide/nickel transport system permease protein
MAQYTLRRLLLSIFVIFGVLIITFVLSHTIPGDPVVAWLGRGASLHPALAKLYAEKYHLNDPVWIQFYYYIINLAQGNLGYSPTDGFIPVTEVIQQKFPYTFQIAFFAFIISVAMGVFLGVVSAKYHHSSIDYTIKSFYLTGVSSPAFLTALVLLIVFTYIFKILPSGGAANPTITAPTPITGIPMLDSLIERNFAYFYSALKHVILPSTAMAIGMFGFIVRVLRNSLLDVMKTNYIKTARAKGLSENIVFFKHALRNAFVSVITIASIITTWLITETIFVETIFAYPGIGQYVFIALTGKDYPGILGVTLLFALIIVTVNLAADLLYAAVDPQIRYG